MASIQTHIPSGTTSGSPPVQTGVSPECGSTTYDIPTKDAACAVPGTSHKSAMEKCCNAPVVTYGKDCGMYCLASGGTVGDLVKCLVGDGVADGQVFCNKQMNATATGAPSSTSSRPTSGTDKPTGTGAAPSSSPSKGAALASVPQQPISKPAIAVLFTLFFSSFASVFLA